MNDNYNQQVHPVTFCFVNKTTFCLLIYLFGNNMQSLLHFIVGYLRNNIWSIDSIKGHICRQSSWNHLLHDNASCFLLRIIFLLKRIYGPNNWNSMHMKNFPVIPASLISHLILLFIDL